MPTRDEVVQASRGRAREARATLARASEQLRRAAAPESVRRPLAATVGALYGAEIADPSVLLEALRRAIDGLRAVRAALPAQSGAGVDPAMLDRVATDLALPRREVERALAEADLAVRVDGKSNHNFYSGFSGGIDEGGLFVVTYDVRPEGTPLRVALELPGQAPIVARAEVDWVRHAEGRSDVRPGMGLRLLDLGDGERQAIAAFMARREPLFHEA